MNDTVTSSPEVTIVDAERAHIRPLVDDLREGDRKEVIALGYKPSRAVWTSFTHGRMNRTALIDGNVVAMWGCAGTYLGEVGHPWLLTGNGVLKVSPLKFARIYQREVYKMLEIFPKLANFVHADYTEAIRLLQIVGFTLGDPEPLRGGIFRKFSMEAA